MTRARRSPSKHSVVSAKLLAQIRDGRFRAGDLLPSEPELCRRYDVSRHTVRVALRSLYEKGLIVSQQGRGSVVQATAVDPHYAFACDSIADLLQFAASTPRRLLETARVRTNGKLARWLGAEAGSYWWCVRSCRLQKPRGPVIASSRIYVPDAFADAVRELARSPLPLFALMEKRYGHAIAEVRQSFAVSRASAEEAADLGLERDAPVMCVERRYFGEHGRLLEVSRNVHPPEGFKYEMTVRRIIGPGAG